jgi:hypothetical protein
MPAKKKDPSVRARRNKSATRATLQRVEQDTTTAEAFEAMTVVQLRSAIDAANATRPADQQLPKAGRKAELIDLLVSASRSIPMLPSHPPRFTEDGERLHVEWHTQTVAWWNDVWTSPMANEWDDSDLHNVFVVALLYDDIWSATNARERKEALSEYRLQRADLGLTPYSRRRLEWTIESVDEAKDRGASVAQQSPQAPAARVGSDDPRNVLRAVK